MDYNQDETDKPNLFNSAGLNTYPKGRTPKKNEYVFIANTHENYINIVYEKKNINPHPGVCSASGATLLVNITMISKPFVIKVIY